MHLRFRVQHTPPRANCQCGFRADLCFSRVKREKGGKYPGFFCISMIRTARRCAAAADRQKSAWFRAKMRKIFKNHLDKPCTACYNIERRFEWIGYSSLAQSVERVTVNHDVVGSSPTGGAKEKTTRTGWSFLCFSFGGLERVCRFRIAKSAAHSRRRQTPWRLPRRRRRAPTGEARKKHLLSQVLFQLYSPCGE